MKYLKLKLLFTLLFMFTITPLLAQEDELVVTVNYNQASLKMVYDESFTDYDSSSVLKINLEYGVIYLNTAGQHYEFPIVKMYKYKKGYLYHCIDIDKKVLITISNEGLLCLFGDELTIILSNKEKEYPLYKFPESDLLKTYTF